MSTLTPALIEALQANSFKPATYDGQPGVFFKKTLVAWNMPYMRAHVIDGDVLFDDSLVTTEVTPDGYVRQLYGVQAEIEPLGTDEAHALLKDAGFEMKPEYLAAGD